MLPTIERLANDTYLRDLSTKTIRGLVDHVKSGGLVGGKIPYGYRKRLVYDDGTERPIERGASHRKQKGQRAELVEGDPQEIAVVRRIFKTYAEDGISHAGIAAALNADSIPSPSGRQWGRGRRLPRAAFEYSP